jgi:protein Tex
VEKILADIQRDVKSVMGDSALLKSLDAKRFADEKFGLPTVADILERTRQARPRSPPCVCDSQF